MRKLFLLIALLFAFPAFGATCKINEYSELMVDSSGRTVMVAKEPAIAKQQVTYTTTTASAAFNAATKFVRIVCDAKAHFEFGSAPTATATDSYYPADTPEYMGVDAADKVAFYDGS